MCGEGNKLIRMPNKISRILPYIILALSCILLLTRLSFLSFWGDELSTINNIKAGLLSILTGYESAQPPLHDIIAYFWAYVFGISEFSLRFLSVLFSISSVFVVYKLGTLLVEEKVGLLSSFILTISPFFILFSRMVRPYSLTVLLALLSLYFFIKVIHNGKLLTYILYILISALLIYTNYVPTALILGQNMLVFCQLKRYHHILKKWILAQILILILYSPHLIILFSNITTRLTYLPTELSEGFKGQVVKVIYTIYSFSLGNTVSPLNLWIVVPGLVFCFFTFAKGIIHIQKEARAILLSSLVLPILFVIVITATASKFETTDHIPVIIMFICPLYYIIIAIGILSFRRKATQIVLILLLAFISGYSIKNYFTKQEFNNPHFIIPWQEIVKYVEKNVQIGDVVVNPGVSFEYYAGVDLPIISFYTSELAKDKLVLDLDYKRFWLIFRDRGQRNIVEMNLAILKMAEENSFCLVSRKCYVKLSPQDIFIKEKILGREVCEYNVTVYLYTRI